MKQQEAEILKSHEAALLEFAKKKHGEQKRKYTGEPYWNHMLDVCKILKALPDRYVDLMIPIAILHDILEDTDCTHEELIGGIYLSGYQSNIEIDIIYGHVLALTDTFTKDKYPSMNRAERKECEVKRMEEECSSTAWCVKLADIIDNARSIKEHDPGFWQLYKRECLQMVEVAYKPYSELKEQCIEILNS